MENEIISEYENVFMTEREEQQIIILNIEKGIEDGTVPRWKDMFPSIPFQHIRDCYIQKGEEIPDWFVKLQQRDEK